MRRVLVIDDHDPSRTQLVKTLRASGYEIAGEGASGRAALTLAQTAAPDALLMAVGLRDMDGIDAARDLMQSKPLPIVLLTSHYDTPTVERAKQARVMAYLVKPLRGEELTPAIELAITRFHDYASLQEENSALKENLQSRKLIERAKGLLMEQRKLSEEQAYSLIKRTSMNMRKPMADVAQAILVAGGLLVEKKN
jgi:two-component system, response regulator PdtaR